MRWFDTATDPLRLIQGALTARDSDADAKIERVVRSILEDVKARGDDAVLDYTRRFDWPEASKAEFQSADPAREFEDDWHALPSALKESIQQSEANIRRFHEAEKGHLQSWMLFPTSDQLQNAISLGQKIQSVERVGFYIPGGKAIYPSTVLMAMIPAACAGVQSFVLCTPPDGDGQIAPVIKAVIGRMCAYFPAKTQVIKIGGAQAIAAMAYGTETVPKCDVIVGPGNHYVNIAKKLVSGDVGIDMLAGPSEVTIIADAGANPAFVAADLLAQTEHGPENRGILFSPSSDLLAQAAAELQTQSETLSRKEILAQSGEHLIFVKTQSVEEAVTLSNILAPEHLELMVREPLALLPLVKNAGAVLMGDQTSAPLGDYWAGPSHTLPTAGTARFSSPLSVATFLKRTSVIYYSPEAAAQAAESIAVFADAEGFDAHARAARLRKGSA